MLRVRMNNLALGSLTGKEKRALTDNLKVLGWV
jgi:hypothetical protein